MLFLCHASIIFLLLCFSADDSCLQMATAPYLGNATAASAHPNDTTQQTASFVSTRSNVQQELLTRKLARESRQEDSKKNEDSSKPKSNSRSSTESSEPSFSQEQRKIDALRGDVDLTAASVRKTSTEAQRLLRDFKRNERGEEDIRWIMAKAEVHLCLLETELLTISRQDAHGTSGNAMIGIAP